MHNTSSPTLGGGDTVETVQKPTKTESRPIVVSSVGVRGARSGTRCCRCSGGIRVSAHGTSERRVEIFQEEYASVQPGFESDEMRMGYVFGDRQTLMARVPSMSLKCCRSY